MSKIAYTLGSAAKAVSVSTQEIVAAINGGQLIARTIDDRVVVLHEDLNNWASTMPTWKVSSGAASR